MKHKLKKLLSGLGLVGALSLGYVATKTAPNKEKLNTHTPSEFVTEFDRESSYSGKLPESCIPWSGLANLEDISEGVYISAGAYKKMGAIDEVCDGLGELIFDKELNKGNQAIKDVRILDIGNGKLSFWLSYNPEKTKDITDRLETKRFANSFVVFRGPSEFPIYRTLEQLKEQFEGVGEITEEAMQKLLKSYMDIKDEETVYAVRTDNCVFPLPTKTHVTSGYGWRKSRVGSKNHQGIDYQARPNTEVYATNDGVVEKSCDGYISGRLPRGCNRVNGNSIKIKLDNGTYEWALHLNEVADHLKPGTRVEKGEIIGWTGNTGRSYGSHLHYQLNDSHNRPIDPRKYLSQCVTKDQLYKNDVRLASYER
ncbi:M23 family metallopeptidase [Candidatus Woesearchaeota archaeon]|nr:M23 family metallopeptidase [Candidatus Woesearchaeota archaeon]